MSHLHSLLSQVLSFLVPVLAVGLLAAFLVHSQLSTQDVKFDDIRDNIDEQIGGHSSVIRQLQTSLDEVERNLESKRK